MPPHKTTAVSNLIVKISDHNLGTAQAREFRDAVIDFRLRGKRAYVFADTFGIEGAGGSAYYIATAFDEIWMQPSGDWGFMGLSIEMPFVRGLLDKIGIAPSFAAREEYKSAMNFLTERGFTPPDREALTSLAENLLNQRVDSIADERGIDVEDIRAYMDEAPLASGIALSRNLIDTLGYWAAIARQNSRRDPKGYGMGACRGLRL